MYYCTTTYYLLLLTTTTTTTTDYLLLLLLLQFGSSGHDHQAFIDEFDLMISNQDIIQF